ncbi:uncharacterized protein LOC125944903 isoform X1 [Dermacentor silvarum]|uniref:uncharacterized protein LOC125942489 isoform X1 n=1 Tax=Dermacentor silvarum TaxID=543639 RepID=UPI002100F9B9|nr:uncharacterized protein LOC125942489 isoform X1 [Dermacentor silvarum]XP_049516776.1 uncharacterized protein LOC125942617 isoform X1 [Dermacentor silvarum]XP_049522276.1 uncharacterized protein LOC125944903 isoform X1 [Dermacentor silvarum]
MAETEEMVLHTSKRLRNLSLEKGKSTKGIITAMASMAPLSQEHADMDIFTGEAIDVVIGSSRDDGKVTLKVIELFFKDRCYIYVLKGLVHFRVGKETELCPFCFSVMDVSSCV